MGLKACSSCESRIEETAVLCPLCGADCGRKTGIRTRPPGEAGPEAPRLAVVADPLTLLPLLLFRVLLAAGGLASIILAIAASPLGVVTKFVREHGVGPRTGAPILWGAAAGFLLLLLVAGSMLRRLRMRRTLMYGEPVKVQWGLGSLILNLLIALFVGPLTAGVALPWLHVRFRQSFYRACVVPIGGGLHLGFQGRGEEVLARFALSLLLLPLGIASGGLLLGLVTWPWVKWEQSNIVVPDRNGKYRTVDFFGSFWSYQARWIGGWLLTLLTAGLYRPWAKVSEWKWIAAHTQMP
jgi:hypothetical protein